MPNFLQRFATPGALLLCMAFIMPFVFSVWMALINNFSVEVAGFTGKEIGILQSLREVPGFLAFTFVWVLLILSEQRFAFISLLLLSVGVLATGYFPTIYGLYLTTVIMSIGFHYFETIHQSLVLQWVSKKESAHFLGKVLAYRGAASIVVFGSLWLLLEQFNWQYKSIYTLFGGLGVVMVIFLWLSFPQFPAKTEQLKKIILRKQYWLFYLLTFLSGARRQIFVVFAGFLLVEKFGYSAAQIALLYLANHVFNMFFAAKIGKWIGKIGERKALSIEYIGLILVFTGYAFVEDPKVAAGLYILDHLFFAMAIAIKTYFQKIANEQDIAATSGVSFTINHIAAVMLPAMLGLVWLASPAAVFLIGAALAACSFVLAQLIPDLAKKGHETRYFKSLAT